MILKEAMGEFTWRDEGEDEKGHYFILTDSNRGFDYNVILIKDTGDVQVNGAYLKTHPRDIQEFVQKKLQACQSYRETRPNKKVETKKKAETKKDKRK